MLAADGFLQFAAGRACLAETGREDNDAANAPFAARSHDFGNRLSRRADYGQVGHGGNTLDIRIGMDTLYHLVLGLTG